jgi:phosphoribosylanthranilate isomerase
MIDGVRLKVCGLTSLVDAQFADRCGADYLGFVLYPPSPRYIPLPQYQAMAPRLPDRRKVAVCVEPDANDLALMTDDFDFFQIHFRFDIPLPTLAGWAKAVGVERLWLAPKLPPAEDVSPTLLRLARYFLLDTFQANGFGGSGKTGDWTKFARHQQNHADRFWILAGGLNPENIGDAVRATHTRFVDVNSGVEAAPGVKDHEKLKQFVVRLHEAATELESKA